MRLFLIGAVVALASSLYANAAENVLEDFSRTLPAGWHCTVTTETGKMGHPHGLGEPLFRIDLVDTKSTFPLDHAWNGRREANPSFRLHFHPIADKASLLKVVRDESLYSWDIPIVFGETREHLVITSPEWNNLGYTTSETLRARTQVERALRHPKGTNQGK